MKICLYQGRARKRMASKRSRKKRNVQVEVVDRLGSLPDDLIHKILSFTSTKETVETSVLSSRWRFVWTSMPYLDFSSVDFSTVRKFSRFVTRVLSGRNNLVDVFSLKLCYSDDVSQKLVNKIMNYAFSHNIQQLYISCLLEDDMEFPLSSLSSRSLKHLSLVNECMEESMITGLTNNLKAMSTWELPALTTLFLCDITFCEDNTDKCSGIFSKCANLENLTLRDCKAEGLNSLSICHPRLSNLALHNNHDSWEFFNVVAPQLKNLTISNWTPEHYVISAPELSSLLYRGSDLFHLSTEGFPSLERVDLSVYRHDYEDAVAIVRLFQEFKSVKYLTLNLEIAELLSSYVEVISDHPSPFTNLKRLKLYPIADLSEEQKQNKVKMSTEVKSYLIDSSPGANFTMVTRKEFRNMKNNISIPKDMAELRVLFEREKANALLKMGLMVRL